MRMCASAPDMQCDAVGKQQQAVVRKGQVRVALPARQLPVDGRQRRIGGAQDAHEARIALVLQSALLLFQPALLLGPVRNWGYRRTRAPPGN